MATRTPGRYAWRQPDSKPKRLQQTDEQQKLQEKFLEVQARVQREKLNAAA